MKLVKNQELLIPSMLEETILLTAATYFSAI